MKKFIFWILVFLAVILVFRIGNIVIFDINRLTGYGMGYLVGLIILLLVIVSLTILLGIKIFGKKRLP